MTIAGHRVKAIVGSSSWAWQKKMFDVLDRISKDWPKDTILISGGAVGVDTLAKFWTRSRTRFTFIEVLPTLIHPTKEEYFFRNKIVAALADEIIAFVEGGKYRDGTWNTIRHFRDLGKPDYVVYDEFGNAWDRRWKKG